MHYTDKNPVINKKAGDFVVIVVVDDENAVDYDDDDDDIIMNTARMTIYIDNVIISRFYKTCYFTLYI